MGDGADLTLESWDFGAGEVYEQDRYTTRCKYCGTWGLTWGVVDGRWRLFEHGVVHKCGVRKPPPPGVQVI